VSVSVGPAVMAKDVSADELRERVLELKRIHSAEAD
jgi:hypothetical protein